MGQRSDRQRRLAFEVTKLVRTFVQEYCPSTAHLLARWGGLKILFNKMPSPWPQRIRDVPSRGLYNWGWDKQDTDRCRVVRRERAAHVRCRSPACRGEHDGHRAPSRSG